MTLYVMRPASSSQTQLTSTTDNASVIRSATNVSAVEEKQRLVMAATNASMTALSYYPKTNFSNLNNDSNNNNTTARVQTSEDKGMFNPNVGFIRDYPILG